MRSSKGCVRIKENRTELEKTEESVEKGDERETVGRAWEDERKG